MKEVIQILQKEIIEALDMKLQYEKIRLQSMREDKPNLQVDLMVKFYENRISQLTKACDILNKEA